MKLLKKLGATSEIWQIFVADSSSTTGAGLTALANNTSGLTAYYHRDTDTTATVISLVTMTVGTFTSSGFKEIDATNMPGWYQFCPPNAALASGAKSCGFHLKGATNMAPLPIEVQLSAVDPDSATAFITGVNSLAPPTNWNLISIDASGRLDIIKINGTSQTARDIGASVLLSTGTGTGQLDFTSGVVKGNVTQLLGGTVPAPNVTGVPLVDLKYTLGTISPATAGSVRADAVTGAVGSVTGAVGSVTGAVGSVTGNVGGNVTGSVGSVIAGVSLTAGQLFVKKNTQITVTFPMTDSTTHLPKTGVTVTAQRSIDGAAVASCANAATELSLGLYSLVLAAADTNGAMITLILSGAASDTRFIGVVTQA